MTRVLALVVFLFGACTLTAEDKPVAGMEGAWDLETGEMAGKPITMHLKGLKYTLGEGKYSAKLGERTETGKYTFDAKKKPQEMDITPADGSHKDKTMPAIVEVDGDTLKVCYDQDGKTRPTKFATSADKPKTILMVFKRAKK